QFEMLGREGGNRRGSRHRRSRVARRTRPPNIYYSGPDFRRPWTLVTTFRKPARPARCKSASFRGNSRGTWLAPWAIVASIRLMRLTFTRSTALLLLAGALAAGMAAT